MLALGSLAFASPWLLAALVALPVIWWLLRVTPPAPRRIAFPAIRLLLGLTPREETPARTPWWLILLRTVLAALVILGLAHPLLNPQTRLGGSGLVALVIDDGWAAARDWNKRQAAARDILAEAAREDRQIVLLTTAPSAAEEAAPALAPIRAADARAAVQALQPKPWPVDRAAALARLAAMPLPQGTASVWLSDGVADDGAAKLAAYLAGHGSLRYLEAAPGDTPRLLAAEADPSELAGKDLGVVVRSLPVPSPRAVTVRASAEDGALLARDAGTIAPGDDSTAIRLAMPSELRNRVTRIDVEGDESAGAVLLIDERWRRRPVGVAAPANTTGQPLLSENYYLERALGPFTEVRRGAAADLLKREIAVLIYSDAGPDSPTEEDAVRKWVEGGGVLLRFAGPRLAEQSDHLLPVRLRRGGRTIGGALSWEKPAKLAPFAADSPFAGLAVPADVTVSRQVLAEPDLDLANKTWARLADGTPLVTAEKIGQGWIVLVHTTANAEWSNLALSGLFVQMLRRVVAMSQGVAANGDGTLAPVETLDGFGRLQHVPPGARPISGKEIATAIPSPQHPPGFYGTADARRALNLSPGIAKLIPIGDLPAGVARESFARSPEVDIRPPLLTVALLLALLDLLIAYALRGLLRLRPARIAAGAMIAAALLSAGAAHADDAFVVRATSELRLAYIQTGDKAVDAVSRAGLVGLTQTLNRRTAVETAEPLAVDIETDDLIFFPLLYWPVTASQPPPSPRAAERVNRYLETGGTILFDTRNSGEETPGPYGSDASSQAQLRRLVAGVKIPPLTPIQPDHVLTKSFYLLHDFPGRWNSGQVWTEPVEDRVNDGVSSVIVGGNDWAGAWAVDEQGRPAFACVPGGEQQREMAMRFGVNLVMYVLTGNYKTDQVHVPAILERLGQ
ncbi:MAG TPA: DUF4159 domain-containing protein [Stellaceae bacterium]|jgi:hypothetical protein|nr:DUF4159 domain-containing protein [Stellaceae bacterium]